MCVCVCVCVLTSAVFASSQTDIDYVNSVVAGLEKE